jgi:hypothetical protein
MLQPAILAPVPCEHLESAMAFPRLSERVAFGSSHSSVPDLPVGLDVFVYASQGPHGLFRLAKVSWVGVLGAVVPAVKGGVRSGKHPDRRVRPPTAEDTDKPYLYFWEVLGLRPLEPLRPLRDFKSDTMVGEVPRWPMVVELDY